MSPPQRGGAASNQTGTSDPLGASGLKVGQQNYDPCAEASKRTEAFAGAIAGAIGGALIGALSGALIAKLSKSDVQLGAKRGALAGLGIGVFAGYNNGLDSFRRQCELYKVARARNADAAFISLSTGKETTGEILVSPDQGYFFVDSDQLTPAGITYFSDLARQYTAQVQVASYEQTVRAQSARKPGLSELNTYNASAEDRAKLEARWRAYRIVVTGHTDDQRDSALAQALSERRAQNVASVLRSAGVPESSLLFQGAGSSYPIADNRTEAGRVKNNRVEVVVLYDEKTLNEYAEIRAPNYEYFSEQTPPPAVVVAEIVVVEPKKAALEKRAPKPSTATATANSVRKPAANVATAQPPSAAPTSSPAVAPAPPVEPGIDLGGIVATSYTSTLAARLGKIKPPSNSLIIDSLASLVGIAPAYATPNRVIESCAADDPQRYQPGQIKRLGDGTSVVKNLANVSVTDTYLSITKLASFSAPAGPHYVEVKNVTAKRTGELVDSPQFNIYKNFKDKTDEQKRAQKVADYSTTPTSYTVLGEGGLLIRQFFQRREGLVCMDLLIPNNQAAKKIPDTALVYTEAGVRKVANLTMER